ncbi:MAG: PD40 domain-containing protein [Phycisphaerales bacterium]|nr:MAG: PD40 domain-containing protein [Phycisphaerales bacterium]
MIWRIMLTPFLLTAVSCDPQTDPPVSGPLASRFTQETPGTTPVQFAPDVFTRELHSSVVFSPDGRELYWSEMERDQIMTMRFENGRWSSSRPVTFSLPGGTGEPMVSPDGRSLFFTSAHRFKDSRGRYDENIWRVTREDGDWSTPEPLPPEVNNRVLHWQVSIAANGNLYFGCQEGSGDIFVSSYEEGKYQEAEILGNGVNTGDHEATPFVSPDESYLLFSRIAPGSDMADLFVSFRSEDGVWMEAISLGETVNSPVHELCPVVSHDGRYLFFLRNLQGDLRPHWVSTSVFLDLRQD